MPDLSIIIAPLIAGMLVIATHVPLGREVLRRGIIFIDLAVAQIAGLGVIIALALEMEIGGYGVQLAAGISALLGGLFLQWSESRWPDIQEAIIGIVFILAACTSLLLLAGEPHGIQHLQDLLVGQILWVRFDQLPEAAVLFTIVFLAWVFARSFATGKGFYLLFALAVTASVQLVGIYLVFASLIIPALAIRQLGARRGLAVGLGIGVSSYLAGLLLSIMTDLPAAPLIVWSLACFSLVVAWLGRAR